MNILSVLIFVQFFAAFFSVVSELILTQSLAAFSGNVVFSYSIAFGLYLYSIGMGALLAKRNSLENKYLTILKVEILLTVLGGWSLLFLCGLESRNAPFFIFMLLSYSMILSIGFLTGWQSLVLMDLLREEKGDSEIAVLIAGCVGFLTGALGFAFIFYPAWGLLPSVFLAAALNALSGLLLLTHANKIQPEFKKKFYVGLYILLFLFFVNGVGLIDVPAVNQFFLNPYLSRF